MTPRERKLQRIIEASGKKPDEHRWLEAVNVCEKLKTQPGALRLAYALFDAFRSDVGYAYPSREYLSLKLTSHETAISDWTSKLRDVGAILTEMQGRVHGDLQRSNDPRSLIFILNVAWADEVLAQRAERKGRLGSKMGRSVVSPATEQVVSPATDIGSEPRYTDNLSGKPTDNPRQGYSDISGSSVYERALGPELPEYPPETEAEGWKWFEECGLTRSEALRLMPALMAGRLYRSVVDQVLLNRRRDERAA